MPFVWKQAAVKATPEGGLQKALDSQTHADCRITSGIHLGKAVNNQTGRSTQAPSYTHRHTYTTTTTTIHSLKVVNVFTLREFHTSTGKLLYY